MTPQEQGVLFEVLGIVKKLEGILTGGNGGGLVRDTADTRKQLQAIDDRMDTLVTKKECQEERKNQELVGGKVESARSIVWRRIERVLLVVVAVCSLLFGAGIFTRSMANAQQNKETLTLLEQLKDQGKIKKPAYLHGGELAP